MDKKDLKIELRGVWYSSARINRVLEYRISPDQDLSIRIEPRNVLERIEKFLLPWKYESKWSTDWFRVQVFSKNNSDMGSREFENDYNWGPYWIYKKEQFEKLKEDLKTYGDLKEMVDKWNNEMWSVWKRERDKWMKENGTWY